MGQGGVSSCCRRGRGVRVSRVAKVLTQVEPDTVSIAVQLEATSIEEASRWHDNTAALLRDDLHARWGDRLMFFTTYMEVL